MFSMMLRILAGLLLCQFLFGSTVLAREQSVNPGVNSYYMNPFLSEMGQCF
jgi:hypothetical protein